VTERQDTNGMALVQTPLLSAMWNDIDQRIHRVANW
jgi:hypothetical protein